MCTVKKKKSNFSIESFKIFLYMVMTRTITLMLSYFHPLAPQKNKIKNAINKSHVPQVVTMKTISCPTKTSSHTDIWSKI